MTSNNQNPRNILSARRLTLLGSVAVVGAALVFGGVGTTSFTAPAFAGTTNGGRHARRPRLPARRR